MKNIENMILSILDQIQSRVRVYVEIQVQDKVTEKAQKVIKLQTWERVNSQLWRHIEKNRLGKN